MAFVNNVRYAAYLEVLTNRFGFFLTLLLALLPAATRGLTPLADIVDHVRPAVVGVGTAYPVRQQIAGEPPYQLLGTGFAVFDGRLIVTSHHILPDALDWEKRQTLAIFVGRGAGAKVLPAKLVASDKRYDLAVLNFTGQPLPALEFANAEGVREGAAVAFTGFPIGAVLGLYPATHRGIVSVIAPVSQPVGKAADLTPIQLKRMRNSFNVFQLDATAYPGNSGSPVYSQEDGRVIGVLNSVFIRESRESLLERPSGISYAIPATYACDLLETVSKQPCQGRVVPAPER